MGAICGIVMPGNDEGVRTRGPQMFDKLKIYSFDKTGDSADHGVYFGCGIQYNTPESRMEELPRRSGESGCLITADAIIDNRDELFQIFGMNPGAAATDSELILKAYSRWGHDCPKHLIGDYAFAIWDRGKQELFCARDPLGSRTLYYSYEQDAFAFCTMEKPLLGILHHPVELNEKWIADFLAIDGIPHEIEYEDTVYKDIYQLPPAYYGIMNAGGFKKERYWDVLKDTKSIRLDTDEEYVEVFNKIFSEAVSCRLRSAGETGIMLSGGMDSGSIACVAAGQLEQTQRKLYGFCSVPVKSFDEEPGKREVYNEKNEVDLIVEAYPNVEMTYCDFEGKNALTDMNELIQIFEQPYKIFQNMTWYHSMLHEAAAQNCTIMLNGQVGNSTISYGDFRVHLLTLFRSGQFHACFKEIKALSRLLNQPYGRVFKFSVGILTPYRIRNWKDRIRNRHFDPFRNVVVKRSFIEKWDLKKRLQRIEANVLTNRYLDYEEDKVLKVNARHFTHIGAIETKLSLSHKITIRDPSRDRRVVEFCNAIPSEQYVREGHERYLLRRAMQGILPDRIRENITKKGIQSADWIHRLSSDWSLIQREMDELLLSGQMEPYIEVEVVKDLQKKLEHVQAEKDANAIKAMLITLIFGRFIQDFNKNTKLVGEV